MSPLPYNPSPGGNGREQAQAGPTDLQSLLTTPAVQEQAPFQEVATDFESLRREMRLDDRRRYQARSFSDYFIASLTPFFIWLMIFPLVWFLIDIRFLYTRYDDWATLNDGVLRTVAIFFVLGVVALNRLIAQEGRDESILYILAFAGTAALVTLSLQGYAGHATGGWLGGPGELLFNSLLVAFIWWIANRLTHECCVDTHPAAGDVGILTGTARRLRDSFQRRESKAKPSTSQWLDLEPVDPSQWKKPEKKPPPEVLAATERLRRRHPGISIFFFSIPVMAIFAIGQRHIPNADWNLALRAHLYVGAYTVSALMLLMLTSLGQLREYFRSRRTWLPAGLSIFWISLGTAMVVLVCVGAAVLPGPESTAAIDPLTYIENDEGVRAFSPLMHRFGQGVLVVFGLFAAYAAIRGLAALAALIARRRDRFPRFITRFFDRLDRILERMSRLPELPRFRRRIRVSRDVSLAIHYCNPLADPARAQAMTTADVIEHAYDALCALAADLGVPRRRDQTPYEFIQEFPRELKTLREEAIELTTMYVQSAYANRHYDERAMDRIRKFWRAYERARSRVVR